MSNILLHAGAIAGATAADGYSYAPNNNASGLTGSYRLNGGYLIVTPSEDISIQEDEDFFVECWFWQFKPVSGSPRLFTWGVWPTADLAISDEGNNTAHFWVNGSNGEGGIMIDRHWGQWHHYAIGRVDNELRSYYDGMVKQQATNNTAIDLTGQCCLGSEFGGSYSSKGNITNFRLIVGNGNLPYIANPSTGDLNLSWTDGGSNLPGTKLWLRADLDQGFYDASPLNNEVEAVGAISIVPASVEY